MITDEEVKKWLEYLQHTYNVAKRLSATLSIAGWSASRAYVSMNV